MRVVHHKLDELLEIDFALVHHPEAGKNDNLRLFFVHVIAKRRHHSSQVLRPDETIIIVVKSLEHRLELLLQRVVHVLHLLDHEAGELLEVDHAVSIIVNLIYHPLEVLFGGELAEDAHDPFDVVCVDDGLTLFVRFIHITHEKLMHVLQLLLVYL